MIDRWELAHAPLEKDAQRYKVRVRATEEDLPPLLRQMPATCGRPFVTLAKEYNFAFYMYALSQSYRSRAIEVLRNLSPNGQVVDVEVSELEKELSPILGEISRLRDPAPSADASIAQQMPEAPLPVFKDSPLQPRMRFETFVSGPGNRFALAAAKVVADSPGQIYNPFFLYGGVGSGKTHLIHAIAQAITAKNPHVRARCMQAPAFAAQVRDAAASGNAHRVRANLLSADLLILDDLHLLPDWESVQDEFLAAVSAFQEAGKQILLAADRPPKFLSGLSDAAKSRVESGLVALLREPRDEVRLAVVRRMAQDLKLALPDDLVRYLSDNAKANVRELEGVLKKIHACVTLGQETPDRALVDAVLSEEDRFVEEDSSRHIPESSAGRVPAVKPAPLKLAASNAEPQSAPKPELKSQASPKPEPPPTVQPKPEAKSEPVKVESAPETAPKTESKPEPKPEPGVHKTDLKPAPKAAQEKPVEPLPPAVARPLDVVCLYPAGKEKELEAALARVDVQAAKLRLRIHLNPLDRKAYDCDGPVDYATLVNACKARSCQTAFVLGPSATPLINPDDFIFQLGTLLEKEKIALQVLSWEDQDRESRAISCALECSLLLPTAKADLVSMVLTDASGEKPTPPAPPAPPAEQSAVSNDKPSSGKVAVTAPKSDVAAAKPPAPDSTQQVKAIIPDAAPAQKVPATGTQDTRAIFFFPQGKDKEAQEASEKLSAAVKKYKLKISVVQAAAKAYNPDAPVEELFFIQESKTAQAGAVIILGPEPGAKCGLDDASRALAVALAKESLPLQYIVWQDRAKDLRYLNCALELSLAVAPKTITAFQGASGGNPAP